MLSPDPLAVLSHVGFTPLPWLCCLTWDKILLLFSHVGQHSQGVLAIMSYPLVRVRATSMRALLTIGTVGRFLVGALAELIKKYNINFPLHDTAKAINARVEPDSYLMGLFNAIDEDINYIPRPKTEFIKSGKLAPPTKNNVPQEVHVAVACMLFVYRILRWMSMGKSWNSQEAKRAWKEWEQKHPDARKEDKLLAFRTDLDGERRFKRVDSPNSAKVYMNYDIEDWGRCLHILTSVCLASKRPYEHLAFKHKAAKFIMVPYDDDSAEEEEVMDLVEAELEKQSKERAMMETFTRMNLLGTNQSPGESKFKRLVHDLVNKRKGPNAEKQLSHEQGMRELSKIMSAVNSYMNVSARSALVGNMNVPKTYKRVDLAPVLAN